jgi:hypothetical protein
VGCNERRRRIAGSQKPFCPRKAGRMGIPANRGFRWANPQAFTRP